MGYGFLIFQFGAIKVKVMVPDHNPPHVHVTARGCEARFEISDLTLLSSKGFSRNDVNRITEELRKRHSDLQEAWNEHHESESED